MQYIERNIYRDTRLKMDHMDPQAVVASTLTRINIGSNSLGSSQVNQASSARQGPQRKWPNPALQWANQEEKEAGLDQAISQ
jgi:hypothetical protein